MILATFAIAALLTTGCEARVDTSDDESGATELSREELDELSCQECTLEACRPLLESCGPVCQNVLDCIESEPIRDFEDSDWTPVRECADVYNRLDSEAAWGPADVCASERCERCTPGDAP